MNRTLLQRTYELARFVCAAAVVAGLATGPAVGQSRIKDIAQFEGVRDNLLVGYGLVIGLNGTGDSLQNAPFTQQSLIGMLERLGVNTRDNLASMKTDNVAAVIVTSTLPAFARQGTRIDVTVGALGDAKSLQGGVLLVTPLLGADGEVYAVSQGSLVIGGFSASGKAQTVTKGVPTTARLPSGAIVEREIAFTIADLQELKISLRNPDFTTASRIATAVNQFTGTGAAAALDPSTVQLTIPAGYPGGAVGFITDIEQIRVRPDQVARVVIDETSGIIVMGADVRISTVAVAQGNLTVSVTETPQVSQPNALSNTGTTQTVDRSSITIDEGQDKRLAVVEEGVTLQELVSGLNALGIGPRDMISILQAIKAAGALQAEVEVL